MSDLKEMIILSDHKQSKYGKKKDVCPHVLKISGYCQWIIKDKIHRQEVFECNLCHSVFESEIIYVN
jgi:hypothetical protein